MFQKEANNLPLKFLQINKKDKCFMNKISKEHEIPNHENRNKIIRKHMANFSSLLVINEMQIRLPKTEKIMKSTYSQKWLVEDIN